MPSDKYKLIDGLRQELLTRWEDVPLAEVVTYIVERLHAEVRRQSKPIAKEIKRLTDSGSIDEDLARSLNQLHDIILIEMAMHMRFEEEIVFPFITALEEHMDRGKDLLPEKDHMMRSFGKLHEEHDQIMDAILNLKVEATILRLPQDVPGTQSDELDELLLTFVRQLNKHLYIEDRILLPRAEKLQALFEKERSSGADD